MSTAATPEHSSFPVAVILRREPRFQGPWQYHHWSLGGVLTDESLEQRPGGRQVHVDGEVTEYLWTGLTITLLRSNAETYWFNLTSTSPALFIACLEDPERGLMPVMATLDQEEATRQFEGDGEVFAADIPVSILPDIEAFVMAHYRPEPRHRRRKPDANRSRVQR